MPFQQAFLASAGFGIELGAYLLKLLITALGFYLMLSPEFGFCEGETSSEGLSGIGSWMEKMNIAGSFDYETYQYPETPLFPGQIEQNHALRLDFRSEVSIGENWRAAIAPFARYDFMDDRQNTIRLNEAWVEYSTENWDFRIGNQIFTWGQMESVNRIDVLNPRDFRDDVIEPSKIGIPAALFRWKFDNSDISAYSIPYYIPDSFPGPDNFYSLSGGAPIREPAERFEDQWAIRYFYAGDGFDFALSWANVIERLPIFDMNEAGTKLIGTPYKSNRLGFEFTKVIESLIVKGEGFYRFPETELLAPGFFYTAGLEYTFPAIVGLSDLTLFTEYFGKVGDGQVRFQILENSLFTGFRLTVNDLARQEFEVGAINNFKPAGTWLVRARYARDIVEQLRFEVTYTDSFGFFVFPDQDEDGDGAFRVRLRYSF